jgi:hypothetical protein
LRCSLIWNRKGIWDGHDFRGRRNVPSRNHFTKIFNNMSKHTPSRVARPPRLGPRWARMLFEHFNFTRGSMGAPLGLPPPLGERGGHPRKSENLKRQIGFYPAATE